MVLNNNVKSRELNKDDRIKYKSFNEVVDIALIDNKSTLEEINILYPRNFLNTEQLTLKIFQNLKFKISNRIFSRKIR